MNFLLLLAFWQDFDRLDGLFVFLYSDINVIIYFIRVYGILRDVVISRDHSFLSSFSVSFLPIHGLTE